MVSGNRSQENGLTIEFIAPKIVDGEYQLEIKEDDVLVEMEYWESTLIMYTQGKDLNMNVIKHYMVRAWNFIQLPNMNYHEEGYFILKFNSLSKKDMVLMKGPYNIHNVPMILRE